MRKRFGCLLPGLLILVMIGAARAETGSLASGELRLELDQAGAIRTLVLGSHRFPGTDGTTGLFVRTGGSDRLAPVAIPANSSRSTEVPGSGLRVTARVESQAGGLLVSGVLEDLLAREDRSADVVFRLPFSPAVWWGSISETIGPDSTPAPVSKRRQKSDLPEGAGVLEPIERGGLAQNFMPVQCVTSPGGQAGVALAIPPDAPCRFRFAYLREQGCLELQFLFGLSQVAWGELKGRAPFRFSIYPVDGRWGFRDALRRYHASYPGVFQRRAGASGLWLVSMPSLKEVGNPEQYAFWQATRLKETPLAVELGLGAYPYTIVGQRELGYLTKKEWSYGDVVAALETEPESTHRSRYSWQEVSPLVKTSGLQDAQGRLIYRLRTTDWAGNSLSFPVNPSPFLPSAEGRPTVASHTFAEVDGALREYPMLSGFFVDSLAMWGSYENHRREHFAAIRAPLSHDAAGRVCLPNWMPHVDYLRELRRRIGGRLVFANGVRPGRAFCSFELDILGMEASLADLASRTQSDCLRALAGPRPAVCLLNYPADGVTRAQAEEYVQRFIALGLAPEMRRVPWPRYWDRDVDLYQRFMPVYRRLDRAGWQPVTHAAVNEQAVWIERFGDKAPELYFSVYNPGEKPVEAIVAIDLQALGLPEGLPWREVVENRALTNPAQPLRIGSHNLRVIQVGN